MNALAHRHLRGSRVYAGAEGQDVVRIPDSVNRYTVSAVR